MINLVSFPFTRSKVNASFTFSGSTCMVNLVSFPIALRKVMQVFCFLALHV